MAIGEFCNGVLFAFGTVVFVWFFFGECQHDEEVELGNVWCRLVTSHCRRGAAVAIVTENPPGDQSFPRNIIGAPEFRESTSPPFDAFQTAPPSHILTFRYWRIHLNIVSGVSRFFHPSPERCTKNSGTNHWRFFFQKFASCSPVLG